MSDTFLYDLDNYQKLVTRIKKYKDNPELYLLGKLTEESGEVAKEIIRRVEDKGGISDMKSELGDLLWVITALAEYYEIQLGDILMSNIEKLKHRDLLPKTQLEIQK